MFTVLLQADVCRFSELHNFPAALDAYKIALEKDPYYVEVYCNIGVIYKNNKKPKEAACYYEKALAICPNFKVARNNLAIALTDIGTLVKASGDISGAINHYENVCVHLG